MSGAEYCGDCGDVLDEEEPGADVGKGLRCSHCVPRCLDGAVAGLSMVWLMATEGRAPRITLESYPLVYLKANELLKAVRR